MQQQNYSLIKTYNTGLLIILLALVFASSVKAQTTIYSTDFGTLPNVNPTNWTFSGLAINISTNSPSSGYSGASGNAYLGEGNSVTFTNTSGATQTVSPLGLSEAILQTSTATFSNVALSFGMRKSSASYNSNATYTLSWSTDGSSYTPIVYTEAAAGSWGLASGAGLTLPAAAANQPSLYIKWAFDRTGTGSNFKIDDVSLVGNFPVAVPVSIGFLSNDTTVLETASTANIYLKLFSTSTASAIVNISVSPISNATAATDYSLGALSFTIPANTPSNTSIAIPVNIVNDVLAESSEYVVLSLAGGTNVSNGSISQFNFYIQDNDKVIPAPSNAIALNFITSFTNGLSGSNSAEIVVHDPTTQRLYIANSVGAKIDIVNFVNPSNPQLLVSVPISTYGNINSVAVFNGTVACAIENTNPQDSGKVVFFNSNGVYLNQVKVGMMPDMITFNHAGTHVLTANEGEPNAAYTNDPDGSVSIIDISNGIGTLNQSNVAQVTFTAYNGQESTLRAQGIRIYGPAATAAKDFEPEYITIALDDSRAWVTLQENNAIVEINLSTNTVVAIRALGSKDHNLLNNGLDASNQTRGINIANFPIKGLYLPDAIASYTVSGVPYLITANEGDARAYSGFSEETRISGAVLDPTKFPNASQIKNNYVLGRLNITNQLGDTDSDGDLDTLYSYGSRSFSIWNGLTGIQVYDSKDDLEQITASNSFSVLFNASNSNNTRKDRSDDKGPEPEGVAIGTIGTSVYAFIALERIGGVMVYDVTNPNNPVYVTYVNNRITASTGPDLGAEGIIFIPQSKSPNGQHLVIAANEISSSLSIWGIPGCASPLNSALSVAGSASNACTSAPAVISVPSNSNATFQWSLNGQSIVGATLSSVSASVSGNYSVAIDGGLNCSTSSLSQSITVKTSPTISVSGPTAACIGSSIALSVSGASTYAWNNGSAGSTIIVYPTSGGTLQVVGTASNGCTAAITKTISALPLPQLSITAAQQTSCAGLPQTFTATGANVYNWNVGGTGASITFSPQNTTLLVVTGTNLNGCSNAASITASVLTSPQLAITSSANNICSGNPLTLSASGANSYTWSNGLGNQATITTPAQIGLTYSVTGTGTNGCSHTRTIAPTVLASPVLSVSSVPATICNGDQLLISASGAFNYLWSNNAVGNSIVVSPSITSTYTLIGSSAQNCNASITVTVNVSECTGIAKQNSNNNITIYPTPASTVIKIQLPGDETYTITLTNSIGQQLATRSNCMGEQQLMVDELPNGVYFITCYNSNSKVAKRIIVAH